MADDNDDLPPAAVDTSSVALLTAEQLAAGAHVEPLTAEQLDVGARVNAEPLPDEAELDRRNAEGLERIESAWERWRSELGPMPGWMQYGEALELIASLTGDSLDTTAMHGLIDDDVAVLARHWHSGDQRISARLFDNNAWSFDPQRSIGWRSVEGPWPENRIWIWIERASLERSLVRRGVMERPAAPARPAASFEPSAHDEPSAEGAIACKICEGGPGTALRDLQGLPPGWVPVGTVFGRLIVLCPSCLTHVCAIAKS